MCKNRKRAAVAALFLFSRNRKSLHQDTGAAEGGLAGGAGNFQSVRQGGDVFQHLIEVTRHGEGLHRLCQLAFPDHKTGEWTQIRKRDGAPQQKVVALPVKDPFHIARNLILILELLYREREKALTE